MTNHASFHAATQWSVLAGTTDISTTTTNPADRPSSVDPAGEEWRRRLPCCALSCCSAPRAMLACLSSRPAGSDVARFSAASAGPQSAAPSEAGPSEPSEPRLGTTSLFRIDNRGITRVAEGGEHATLYRRRRCVTNGELTLTLLSTSQAKSEVPLPELLHRPMPPPFQLPLAAPVYMHAAGPHPPETASALEAILARLARRAKRKQRAGLGEQFSEKVLGRCKVG